MRKILPSKSISGARNSVSGVDGSLKDASRKSESASQDQRSLQTEASKKHSCSKPVRREHWCPTCSEDEKIKCNTPVSCDENVSAPNEKEAVFDSRRMLSSNGISSSYPKKRTSEKLRKPLCGSNNRQFKEDKCVVESEKQGGDVTSCGSLSNPNSPLRSTEAVRFNGVQITRAFTSISQEKYPIKQRIPTNVTRRIFDEPKYSSNSRNEVQVRKQTSGLLPLDSHAGSMIYSSFSNTFVPISRTSKDGASIISQPRSSSFSDGSISLEKSMNRSQSGSMKVVEAFSLDKSKDETTERDEASSNVSMDGSQLNYLSARAVAERLAKAIRGSSTFLSKGSKDPASVPAGNLPIISETQNEIKSNELQNSQSKQDYGSVYPSGNSPNIDNTSEASVITFESDVCSTSDTGYSHPASYFENGKRKEQIEFLLDQDLLNGDGGYRRSLREKLELLSSSKKELESKQNENRELKEKINKLIEEKAGLQVELTNLNSEHNLLFEKIKSFEQLMDGHRKRVEETENTILNLRHASIHAQRQAEQAEKESQILRKSIEEKEGENISLRKSLCRLQVPLDHECKDMQIVCRCLNQVHHGKDFKEKNVRDLQQELVRLIDAEKSLQQELVKVINAEKTLHQELQVSRFEAKSLNPLKCSDADLVKGLEAENSYLKSQVQTLRNENSRLASTLRTAANDKKEADEACETSETPKSTGEDELKFIPSKVEMNLEPQKRSDLCLSKEHTEGERELPILTNLSLKKLQGVKESSSLKEVELELTNENYTTLSQRCAVLQSENTQLQSSLRNVNKRIVQLENQLKEKEEDIKLLQKDKEHCCQEISRLMKELSTVCKEREDMQMQAEDIGREALRMSAQVEVLRRRANQLEEDVLMKEGQISILAKLYESCD